MIAFVRRQPVMAVLGVVAILLVALIVVEAQLGARLRANAVPPAQPAAAAQAKLLPPVGAITAEQAYPQTTTRPLFTPTRRPAPAVEVAQQPAFVKGQFVLLGVTIAGDTRIALLREKSNGRIHRVGKGNEVNGIKVAEVKPDAVTMTQAGDSEVLPLTVQKAPPGAAAALLGPFGGAGSGMPTAMPVPAAQPPQNVSSMPPGTAAPPVPPAQPALDHPFGPRPSVLPPTAPQQPAQGAVPLSPEELLARRRARRTEQSQ